MQIKRYEATNLHEATVRIKKDLGPDAIILSTGKISDRPHLIEVLAARDEQTAPPVFRRGGLTIKSCGRLSRSPALKKKFMNSNPASRG